jgi:release factor glutamine methyltransferase
VTTAYSDVGDVDVVVAEGVYAPQQDSQLLIDVMEKTGLAAGHRVADLCTGSGVVAIAAARQGASIVTAFDICPRAVRCARANALAAGVGAEVHLGSWARAMEFGPFDLVVCNPPYVPHASDEPGLMPAQGHAARAVNAGLDGRLVLDPLCVAAPELLCGGGTMLLVHSELAGIEASLTAFGDAGLHADVIAQQWIPFGPVLTARAAWLERVGLLAPGRRNEKLVVIRAEKQ